MVRTLLARIEDMLEAIDEVTRATADQSFATFQQDWVLRKAAERGIEIISEASRHLPDELKSRHPYPRWSHVAGIGNVLRHEYHCVEERILWTVIQDELPRPEKSSGGHARGARGSALSARRLMRPAASARGLRRADR